VLLGASNAVLGFRCAVRAARAKLGAPLEVLAAVGHGRSYGVESSVFRRQLPAIASCGLWSELRERPASSTFAIVTDLGNDLAYGFAPDQVQAWLEESLDRLADAKAQVVITGLPLDAVKRLQPWKFKFFSRLFFPQRGLDQQHVTAAAEELDRRVDRLARERKLVRIVPRSEWYEHDPIHITLDARREAWSTYVASWRPRDVQRSSVDFDAPWRQRGRLAPQQRKMFGRETGRAQPCARLADGTQFFLY
jgi:hypothetical protein